MVGTLIVMLSREAREGRLRKENQLERCDGNEKESGGKNVDKFSKIYV